MFMRTLHGVTCAGAALLLGGCVVALPPDEVVNSPQYVPGALTALCLLLFATWWFGKWLGGRRRHGAYAVALLLVVLCWDMVPGYLIFRSEVRRHGTPLIKQRPIVGGYVDQALANGQWTAWQSLLRGPYKYVELRSHGGPYSPFPQEPTYFRFFVVDRPDARCEFVDGVKTGGVAGLAAYGLPETQCVAMETSATPYSRYHWGYRYKYILNPDQPFFPVVATTEEVTDLHTGETIASYTSMRYVSWLARLGLGTPQWTYGAPVSDRTVTNILIPAP